MNKEPLTMDDLTPDERKTVEKYRSLSNDQKSKLWAELARYGAVVSASDSNDQPTGTGSRKR